jgi:hypothetical protein
MKRLKPLPECAVCMMVGPRAVYGSAFSQVINYIGRGININHLETVRFEFS